MTQLEILKLALDGVEQKIRSAADLTRCCVTDKHLKELKDRIKEHDEIAELIKQRERLQ